MRSLLWCALLSGLLFPNYLDAQQPSCETAISSIQALLQNAQCAQAADCQVRDLPPPFGCGQVLHKDFAKQLDSATSDFLQLCPKTSYHCSRHRYRFRCVHRQCVVTPVVEVPKGVFRR